MLRNSIENCHNLVLIIFELLKLENCKWKNNSIKKIMMREN